MGEIKLNFKAVFICGLASLFYLYDFLLRVMPSAMTNDLMNHFHIGAASLGVLLSIFYYAYAPIQIPAGLLLDRFGARSLLTIMALICALGALLFGITDNILIAAIGRFLIGLSAAFAFLGTLVLAVRWLPGKYFALFVGLVQLLGCAGSIVGEKPIAIAVSHFGWQNTNTFVALMGFVLAILFWLLLRNHPKESIIKHTKHLNLSVAEKLRAIYKNAQNWAVGLYAIAIWGPATMFPVVWGVSFIMSLYKIKTVLAAETVSLVWIGIGVGAPLIGWWSDHIGKRRVPLIASAFVGIFISSFILYIHAIPIYLMYLLLFLLGIGISSVTLTFGVIRDNNHPAIVGTANGFNSMIILMGGMLFQPLVGFILHFLWDGTFINNTPIYSLFSYRIALSILPICFLIALITGLFLIKETYCHCSK